ncbi:hypothetical protein DNTS_010920 [Danionella cerebrum]|uniref:DNA-repair protein Xrcc1 N-terminal domain-containing protein n=1 Tax=Danionella cerebrum TaxID=2873325 RepID=A0A553PEB3_9TELE|nr:hypothetical protein DNTS_010920 [Danionella translucida]
MRQMKTSRGHSGPLILHAHRHISFSSQEGLRTAGEGNAKGWKTSVVSKPSWSESSKPWLSNATDHTGVLRVELQLERVASIGFIDVGNCGSAFIQVDVGRSSWSLDHPYVTLLPTTTLMNPADSKNGKGRLSVRMFKRADFLHRAAEESWDRLRLTPEKMTSVSEWLSSPAIKNTFFGQITRESSSMDQRNLPGLSRAERMVIAAQSKRRSLSSSPASGSRASNELVKIPQDQRRKSKARHSLVTSGPSLKKSRPSSHDPNSSPENVRIQSPIDTLESTCPLCGESFSPKYLPFHASSCLDSAIMGSPPSFSFFAPEADEPMVSCPLCCIPFPPEQIQQHASSCGDS